MLLGVEAQDSHDGTSQASTDLKPKVLHKGNGKPPHQQDLRNLSVTYDRSAYHVGPHYGDKLRTLFEQASDDGTLLKISAIFVMTLPVSHPILDAFWMLGDVLRLPKLRG